VVGNVNASVPRPGRPPVSPVELRSSSRSRFDCP
jgi:hypothetical protein